MAERAILEALQARFATLATTPALDKVNPRQRYKPTAGVGFLRAWLLPATTGTPFIDNAAPSEFRGVFQIDVMTPEGTDGLNAPYEVAEAILDHFAKGTTMLRDGLVVRVIRRGSIGPVIEEGGWSKLPVSISYLAHA